VSKLGYGATGAALGVLALSYVVLLVTRSSASAQSVVLSYWQIAISGLVLIIAGWQIMARAKAGR
jgi:hypothetical protein